MMGSAVLVAALGLICVLAVAVFVPLGRAFRRELKYVNMKIMNSRHDKEQAYWEQRKKNLWLSLLPFRHYNPHHHNHKDQ